MNAPRDLILTWVLVNVVLVVGVTLFKRTMPDQQEVVLELLRAVMDYETTRRLVLDFLFGRAP